jgi:hypothetical protein
MLRINLLPPYIYQRKKTQIAILVMSVFIVAEIGAFIAFRMPKAKRVDDLRTESSQKAADLASMKPDSATASSEKQTADAARGVIDQKLGFIRGVLDYNKTYPALYEHAAAYTYREAMMLDLEATGNTLKFDAYVSNPSDVSRLMLGLTRSSELQGLPQVTGVPFWDPQRIELLRNGQDNPLAPSTIIGGRTTGAGLIASSQTGAGGAGSAAPGGGPMSMMMSGGRGGGGGGYPGGGGGGPAAMSGPMAASSSMGAAPGTAGGPGAGPMSMAGPGGRGGGGGGYPGGGGGGGGGGMMGGGGGGDINVLLAGASKQPLGFKVSVICQLRNPAKLVRPEFGTSGSQLGSSSGGGMGGMMGGGGMGGGYPGGGGGGGMSGGYGPAGGGGGSYPGGSGR